MAVDLTQFVGKKKKVDLSRFARKKPSFGQRLKQQFKKGAKELAQPLIGAAKGVASTVSGISELGQRGLRKATPKFVSPAGKKVMPEIAALPEKITKPVGAGQKIGFAAEQIAEFAIPATKVAKAEKAIRAVPKVSRLLTKVATKAPRTARLLPKMAAEAVTFGGVEAAQKGKIDKSTAKAAAIGAALPVVGAVGGRLLKPLSKASRLAKAEVRLAEKTAPKLTSKLKRLAREQKRVVEPKQGRLSKFIFGKKTPIIKPTKGQKEALEIINKEIPGHGKLNEFALEKAIRQKSLEKVAPLKKALQKIKINTKAFPKLRKAWKKIKIEQKRAFDFADTKVGTIHRDFDRVLNKIMTKKGGIRKFAKDSNMDDIWDLAKAYDKSIPGTIKNATKDNAIAWVKREAWMQNRALLRDFIKANAKSAKKSFNIMHRLITTAEDMASRGVETKVGKGLLSPGFGTKQALKIGGAAVGGGVIGKRLGLF